MLDPINQALAGRRLDAPESFARLQVVRLMKALRCADMSLEENGQTAIAPFLQAMAELNRFHGLAALVPPRRERSGAAGNFGRARPAVARPWPGPRTVLRTGRRTPRESRKGGPNPLKSLARVTTCASAPRTGPGTSGNHPARVGGAIAPPDQAMPRKGRRPEADVRPGRSRRRCSRNPSSSGAGR